MKQEVYELEETLEMAMFIFLNFEWRQQRDEATIHTVYRRVSENGPYEKSVQRI